MGIALSRFRRKLTSFEELEKIEEKIRDIENYKEETAQRQKRVVGRLVIYSVGVYVLAAAVFYFLFFPASLRDRLFYIVPLLIFPIIVLLTKKLISWYYIRRMSEQQDLLRRLRTDKRQLLEKVMEKETYKVARTILEKFAPDQLRNNNKTGLNNGTPNANAVAVKPILNTPSNSNSAIVPVTNNTIVNRSLNTTVTPLGSELRYRMNNSTQLQALPPVPSVQSLQPAIPRIRPVLPKESGILDRLIETLVGDGPSWRYALICTQCYGHNGMALREEFPFLAFRCCYCSYYNQAKKQRPLSPRLLDKQEQRHEASSDSDPDSETQTSENEETQVESKDCPNETRTEISEAVTVTETINSEPPEEPVHSATDLTNSHITT